MTKGLNHAIQQWPGLILSITPDRGKEFANVQSITEEKAIPFYFPDPHSPWQRGTNENTNGLLREYMPKGVDISTINDKEIQGYTTKLNKRPRKCLGWKTPYESFFNVALHLI